jgi:hypothetical protein
MHKPSPTLGLREPIRPNFGGASPPQLDIVPTIFPAQHSIGSEAVTLPKSLVTFAEIRIHFPDSEPDASNPTHRAGLSREEPP